MPTMTLFLDAGRAKELDFSFALKVTGSGSGIWDFRASDAGWMVEEVMSADADLMLSMDLGLTLRCETSLTL